VLKWFITLIVALVLISALTPMLQKLGLGRLPGDIVLKRRGKDYALPIMSTLLLSALLAALTWAFT
jgi:hypothetical protein